MMEFRMTNVYLTTSERDKIRPDSIILKKDNPFTTSVGSRNSRTTKEPVFVLLTSELKTKTKD